MAALTSSTVTSLSRTAVRSISDTSLVGTRSDMPWNLPFNSGSTRATALAAPVLVGMMLTAAARARRRSAWGASRIFWSVVYECTVVISAEVMPNDSCKTLATGARQLVVHEALLTML